MKKYYAYSLFITLVLVAFAGWCYEGLDAEISQKLCEFNGDVKCNVYVPGGPGFLVYVAASWLACLIAIIGVYKRWIYNKHIIFRLIYDVLMIPIVILFPIIILFLPGLLF